MSTTVYTRLVSSPLRGIDQGGGKAYQVTNVVRHLKLTIGASTLGMDNTFRDSLPVKVCQQIDQVKVLEQKRTILAHPLRGLWVHHRTAIGGRVDRSLIITVGT